MNGRRTLSPFLLRYVIHPIEAVFAFAIYGAFAVMPVGIASGLGGWLMRTVGPRLAVSRRAVRNLRIAFPDVSPQETARILAAMWDNLGRLAGEYPHIGDFRIGSGPGHIEVVGMEQVERLRQTAGPAIMVTGHIGNWELFPAAFLQLGMPLDIVYRAANNRLVDGLYRYGRSFGARSQIAKGSAGARQLLTAIRQGRNIAMLVDQKMNDGIPVPFFGRLAMTAPAVAELALRYNCLLFPVRMERLASTRLRITVFPPLEHLDSGDRRQDVLAIMTRVNALMESWIRERPEQWLWLHNRWPDPGEG